MTGEVSGASAIAIGIAFVIACIDWWSVATSRRWVEAWAKPAVVVALIAAAVLLEPANSTIGWLITGGLFFGLLGDVALFLDYFEVGASAFLVGHVLYIAAFVYAWTSWVYSLVVMILGLVLIATVGRRIATTASKYDERLESLILLYQVALVLMAVAGFGTKNPWVMIGAVLFVISDTYLGWTRFVGQETTPSRVIVHVTYHLAQASFVLSLVALNAS
jgi:uncharacterized membrane protein YhhN